MTSVAAGQSPTSQDTDLILSGTIASAGSKILITGGYLVLHQPNNGTVLGVDAKLHTGVYSLLSSHKDYSPIKSDNTISYPIVISTPQRQKEPLVFYCTLRQDLDAHQGKSLQQSPFTIEIVGPTDKNPFVAKSLHYSLIAISSLTSPESFQASLSSGLYIHIRGDRSFYSSEPATSSSPTGQQILGNGLVVEPQYNDDPSEYQTKTGLGSSAAVVSSLVAALFAHFGIVKSVSSQSTIVDQQPWIYAYRIAQIAHCIAQGKVGSGFDVATAFFGTQLYCRFSPSLIQELISSPLESSHIVITPLEAQSNHDSSPHPVSTPQQSHAVISIMQSEWDDRITPYKLPPGLRVLLGDVHGGSETPSMVKKIEQWRKSSHSILWDRLGAANQQVERDLAVLSPLAAEHPSLFTRCISHCMSRPASDWDVVELTDISSEAAALPALRDMVHALVELNKNFLTVRRLLAKLGQQADVPVEPPVQTAILDELATLPGVVMAGVPGAGGFDAMFAIVLEDGTSSAANGVLNLWRQCEQRHGCKVSQLPVDIDHTYGVNLRSANVRLFQKSKI